MQKKKERKNKTTVLQTQLLRLEIFQKEVF